MISKEKRQQILAMLLNKERYYDIRDKLGVSTGLITNVKQEAAGMLNKKEPRILVYDIETAPLKAAVWRMWDTNVVWLDSDWYMLSFSAKWLGEDKVHNFALNQYKGYKPGSENDKAMVADLWEMMDEADIVIAHNGDKFDNKKSCARFLFHGMNPPRPYQSVDTLKVARKYFNFSSNKLNSLGETLKLGKKVDTGGYKLWQGCLAGDKESWSKMVEYNEQDVNLLEKVYLKLRPWMKGHPSLANITGETHTCPNCGSSDVTEDGVTHSKYNTFTQYKCNACGSHPKGKSTTKKGTRPEYKPN